MLRRHTSFFSVCIAKDRMAGGEMGAGRTYRAGVSKQQPAALMS